jgi:hypothetical protein
MRYVSNQIKSKSAVDFLYRYMNADPLPHTEQQWIHIINVWSFMSFTQYGGQFCHF